MVEALNRGGIGLVLIAFCGPAAAGDWAVDSFCAEVQRVTAGTGVQAELVIHKTTGAYRASKPGIFCINSPSSAGDRWPRPTSSYPSDALAYMISVPALVSASLSAR